MKYPQRVDYMDGKVTHEQFYLSIAHEAGISFSTPHYLFDRAKHALENGDEHLNTIPLETWDVMGSSSALRSNLQRSFKLHGDFMSLAGIVCVLKNAMIEAVKRGD